MREPRRQVIKKIDGKPVVRRTPGTSPGAHASGFPTAPPPVSPPQPLLAASLDQANRTLELRQERIRELESKVAEQASELATLNLELASARATVTRLEQEKGNPVTAPAGDPLLTERLHDLEKQVSDYQQALEQRTAENRVLQSRVYELESSRKSQQLQAGVDVGGGLRDL